MFKKLIASFKRFRQRKLPYDIKEAIEFTERFHESNGGCPICGDTDNWYKGPEGGCAELWFCASCCTEFVMSGMGVRRSSNEFSTDLWYGNIPEARERGEALAEANSFFSDPELLVLTTD